MGDRNKRRWETLKHRKREVMQSPFLKKGHTHPEIQLEPEVCTTCNGYGVTAFDECDDCGGSGYIIGD